MLTHEWGTCIVSLSWLQIWYFGWFFRVAPIIQNWPFLGPTCARTFLFFKMTIRYSELHSEDSSPKKGRSELRSIGKERKHPKMHHNFHFICNIVWEQLHFPATPIALRHVFILCFYFRYLCKLLQYRKNQGKSSDFSNNNLRFKGLTDNKVTKQQKKVFKQTNNWLTQRTTGATNPAYNRGGSCPMTLGGGSVPLKFPRGVLNVPRPGDFLEKSPDERYWR